MLGSGADRDVGADAGCRGRAGQAEGAPQAHRPLAGGWLDATSLDSVSKSEVRVVDPHLQPVSSDPVSVGDVFLFPSLLLGPHMRGPGERRGGLCREPGDRT